RAAMQYDFAGQVLLTHTEHQRDGQTGAIEVDEAFAYTDAGRLEEHTHTVNGGNTELISHSEYDALGQLAAKLVGGDANGPLQIVDYKYNIRGWLTDINNVGNLNQPGGGPVDLFAFRLAYNTVTDNINGQVKPLFNGNIAETSWRTAT